MIPTISRRQIPFIGRKRMAEVDRLMLEKYHIDLIQMMENAGNQLARLTLTMIDKNIKNPAVLVLAGKGGNGGGALSGARHLSNMGCTISVCLSNPPEQLDAVTFHQLEILQRMRIPILSSIKDSPMTPTVIIDGLIGYNLNGSPRGRAAELIDQANNQQVPVLSLDLPSGLDADSGEHLQSYIEAHHVLTLALPKTGLKNWPAAETKNRLFLADIGVPPELYRNAFGLEIPTLFRQSPIIEIVD